MLSTILNNAQLRHCTVCCQEASCGRPERRHAGDVLSSPRSSTYYTFDRTTTDLDLGYRVLLVAISIDPIPYAFDERSSTHLLRICGLLEAITYHRLLKLLVTSSMTSS